jgi:hypothetical protein
MDKSELSRLLDGLRRREADTGGTQNEPYSHTSPEDPELAGKRNTKKIPCKREFAVAGSLFG